MNEIAIVGAGIGGLTLALELHRRGVPCKVYEAVPEIAPLGVGVNLLPHASKVMSGLGLEKTFSAVAVVTEESAFFNRFGQLIYREDAGRKAGYAYPQYSVHRGDLQHLLLKTVLERLGADAIVTDHRAIRVESLSDGVIVKFERFSDGTALPPVKAAVAIGCDGLHSALRKQFYPEEGGTRYSGIMMWRGTTVHEPFLTGATMVRIGSLREGKIVAYPIRQEVPGEPGKQLINWVAEIEAPEEGYADADIDPHGYLAEMFKDWEFDWLDIPGLIRGATSILRYPMVDRVPVDRWTFDRVTLLGDAAHPMVPRGSNGAGQAIVDARVLAELISGSDDPREALAEYERIRLPATTRIVQANHETPPDHILQETMRRTGDQRFENIHDHFTAEELESITRRYQEIAGFTVASLNGEEDS